MSEPPALPARTDGLVWVDIPVWDEQAEQTLTHDLWVSSARGRDSANRNQVPKIHRYDDHLFLVLHAPQPGAGGRVHYVELDQFIGDRYLSPPMARQPRGRPVGGMFEVNAVLGRLTSGRLKPERHSALLRPAHRIDGTAAHLHRELTKTSGSSNSASPAGI